jgi:acylphosphatase
MTTLHCFVSGRVQGVFFRSSTQEEAKQLGLSGWVRNLPDGRVEVLAQGDSTAIEQLRSWLEVGPRHAWVSDVECVPSSEPKKLTPGFRVI